MSFYLSAMLLGLSLVALGFGIYISMRIFNIPDITTDGSYTLGAVVAGLVLSHSFSPLWTVPVAMLAGAAAGAVTGFIHTRLRVNALLSGILVMTALYSVNLMLLGRSNLPLLNIPVLFDSIPSEDPFTKTLVMLILLTVLSWTLLSWLLRTDFGLAMRATGSNELMMRTLGLNTGTMKIKGLAIANAFTALSGALVVQYQGYVDINMGIGVVITGLGAVMIGEALVKWLGAVSIAVRLGGVILGSILFRGILAFTLSQGMDPNLLKLATAVFVLVAVTLPNLKKSQE
jgi:putative tryptophan/tyrosine transport system permease protein